MHVPKAMFLNFLKMVRKRLISSMTRTSHACMVMRASGKGFGMSSFRVTEPRAIIRDNTLKVKIIPAQAY